MKLEKLLLNLFVFLVALTPIMGASECPAAPIAAQQSSDETADKNAAAQEPTEPKFLSDIRQLTFEGKRAGEGYFSPSGSQMVFQSERREENPFFQIYLLDFETGDVVPVSPGHGKTTCAWVGPDEKTVLYASTQDDPEAVKKQLAEIEMRESGTERRYSWDYDENYELYSWNADAAADASLNSKKYTQLTDAVGYDAEGSYSPDGKLIAFASNRNAYSKPMTAEQQKKFEQDPAYMMEIFIMDADGSNVRQLTDVAGYDGGPFFSPDGQQICWRRFGENGATAEIMTMNIDGSDQKTLTRIGALSWAPFYHPSGDYLIFTTNKHGFANFELYLVAADGKSPPVRVTDTAGFDGLASFSPDGTQLTWTSNRNAKKQSQIYLAKWNDEHARKLLGIGSDDAAVSEAAETGKRSAAKSAPAFRDIDMIRHVEYLCRKDLGGRMTGSRGERMATAYVSAYFDYLGLQPAGDDGSWLQKFSFPDGAKLGDENVMAFSIGEQSTDAELNQQWRPLTFSGNLKLDPTNVVFAGYGIVAQESETQPAYDSYAGLDEATIKDKWVLMFRFVPEDVTPEQRQHLNFYSDLRKKLLYAREKGAAGIIVVSGPNSQVNKQLVPLYNDSSPNGSSIAAVSITDAVAEAWLKSIGKDLATVQKSLDDGTSTAGFEIPGLSVSTTVDVQKVTGTGHNVVGRLIVGDKPSEKVIVVGAHIDHLGNGQTSGSLARNDEKQQIHFGADDNASGIAAMLEIAEYIASQKKSGKAKLKHDIIFAGWSGEELGLFGSKHFATTFAGLDPSEAKADKRPDSFHDFVISIGEDEKLKLNGQPTTAEDLKKELAVVVKLDPNFPITVYAAAKTTSGAVERLKKQVAEAGMKKVFIGIEDPDPTANRSVVAALNMDMVGRLEDKLILQGIGSSDAWNGLIESTNAVIGLPLTLSDDTDLPTDASSFYRAGVPILSAFTGSHRDYHTPRDTPEKLNYPDAARIAKLMGLVTRKLSISEQQPDFIRVESKPKPAMRGGLRAYLGTVPDYGAEVVGVKLDDVTSGAPADAAGIKGGDIITRLAGTKIENIYDYTAVIDRLKPGQAVKVEIDRNGEQIELEMTPGSRN